MIVIDSDFPLAAETLENPCYHWVTLHKIPGHSKPDKQARLADATGDVLVTLDTHD